MPPPIVPSNPGWYTGYIPSAIEWANEWSSKVDFPAPVNQGGTGGQTPYIANQNLQQRFLLAGGASYPLQTLSWYGLRTAGGPIQLDLPPLSSVTLGDWIEFVDLDDSAAANSVQLFCNAGDQLLLWGVEDTTALFNISGTRALVVAGPTYWGVSVW